MCFQIKTTSTPIYKKLEITGSSRGKEFNLTKNVTTTTGWSFQGALTSEVIIKLLSGNVR